MKINNQRGDEEEKSYRTDNQEPGQSSFCSPDHCNSNGFTFPTRGVQVRSREIGNGH